MFLLRLIYPLLIVGFSVLALRSLLFWATYIQRKQYRLDRLWHAIASGEVGPLLWSTYRLGLLFLFLILELVTRFWQQPIAFDIIVILLCLYWLAWTIQTMVLLTKRDLTLPDWTLKISIFILLAISLEGLVAWQYRFWPEILLALEITAPLLICLLFAFLVAPNTLLQRLLITQAVAKRQRFPDLRVIGITGSFGKTTTKEYIAHILASKYRVLKTPGHINVDTGVARIVRQELNQPYDFFVVEMGAYRLGEIASICRIVQPNYAVLTALGDQHVELFGSLAHLEAAKFELIDAVDNANHCYANAQSSRLIEAMTKRGIKPVWYGLQGGIALQPQNIKYSQTGTTFTLQGVDFVIPSFGSANLVNALGAITICRDLGMNLGEIAKAVATLPIIEHTVQLQQNGQGALLIDSTYNASVEGVESAIEDLAITGRAQRILIFRQIIELGERAEADHRRLARSMAKHLKTILLLPSPWRSAMVDELQKQGFATDQILSENQFPTLRPQFSDSSVVLFAGRDAAPFLEQSLL